MTALPVIARELRAESRKPFTYWLRVLGAGLLWVVVLLSWGDGPSNRGDRLFQTLHAALFFSIWVFVPLVTADCISRERREGTLGLLFLTPLKAGHIAVAKSLAHGLRAFTLGLATLPLLTLPFLMGGVAWQQALLSFLILSSAFFWALGAGLLASSGSKSWQQALVWAVVLGCGFFALFCGANSLAMVVASGGGFANWSSGTNLIGMRVPLTVGNLDVAGRILFLEGLVWATLGGFLSYDFRRISPPIQFDLWLSASTGLAVVSLAALAALLLLAAWQLRRKRLEEPPSTLQLRAEKYLCTPVLFTSFLRRSLRRRLERNPIGWLTQRRWTGRLVAWSWLAVVLVVSTYALADLFVTGYVFYLVNNFLAVLLLGSVAVSAAGSFRRERGSGALELLLVTPLSVGQIIRGRLRALWTQFWPAAGLLLGSWLYLAGLDRVPEGSSIWFYTLSYVTLPVVGLYYSLRQANFISALAWTLAVGLLLPAVASLLPDLLREFFSGSVPMTQTLFKLPSEGRKIFSMGVSQLTVAAFCAVELHNYLVKRSFALGRKI
jgi:ABC-type transport system involved in cytochrome c biogenesis permease component